eukprot:scaffold18141_cov48-Phaeocystis_antarctica.AAC.4
MVRYLLVGPEDARPHSQASVRRAAHHGEGAGRHEGAAEGVERCGGSAGAPTSWRAVSSAAGGVSGLVSRRRPPASGGVSGSADGQTLVQRLNGQIN